MHRPEGRGGGGGIIPPYKSHPVYIYIYIYIYIFKNLVLLKNKTNLKVT